MTTRKKTLTVTVEPAVFEAIEEKRETSYYFRSRFVNDILKRELIGSGFEPEKKSGIDILNSSHWSSVKEFCPMKSHLKDCRITRF